MDDVARQYYELTFKVAFMEKKADEFQDFFSAIMEKRYPTDFMRVKRNVSTTLRHLVHEFTVATLPSSLWTAS